MKHELPALPYAKDALEPHISMETLEFHYGKHHKAYVKKLNELIGGGEFSDAPLEEILLQSTGAIFNNAAQVWNHNFYWNCMSPEGGGAPRGELARAVDAAFQSFTEFKKKFSEAVEGLFGSGWVWLVQSPDGTLAIIGTSNADTPMRSERLALLACDVWEHAYYIDYRNSRPDFLKAWWRVVNWDFVSQRWSGNKPKVEKSLASRGRIFNA
ncbi:MAG: superoxide dismutase [Sulfuricaulis sp.]